MSKKTTKSTQKYFVLDTSVLLYDHNSILAFEEHKIIIPITVLEELDRFKAGNESINFEAREAIRLLDKLSEHHNLNEWIPLGEFKGKLKFILPDNRVPQNDALAIFGGSKNDHLILNCAILFSEENKDSKVVLVSKDINLRLKAKALGLDAEDYLNGSVRNMQSISESFGSLKNLSAKIINDIHQKGSIAEGGILNDLKYANGYYVLNNCTESALVRYDELTDKIVKVEKSYAYGIKPKNSEQTFAIDALLNKDIKLVALQGVAGTGKTLLALAAALEQVNTYERIILSRPIVSLSNKEIGFLPGDADDKISPYMQPLWDNFNFIRSQTKETSRKGQTITKLKEDGTIEITALTFIRGRSLSNVFFIVDEAQNLTPHEIKTIITRAGEGTKIVFTGDVHQIDTPYMDEKTNGLSYVIDRLKGSQLFAHIKLEKGVRSELANLANTLL